MSSAISKTPWNHNNYSNPAGYAPLRIAIAQRLKQYRNISCDPENIIITNGSVQTINLICKVLFEYGDTIAFESPSPSLFAQITTFNDINVQYISVTEEGLDIDHLQNLKKQPSGVFVGTANQTPMSVSLSLSNKKKLLNWAIENNSWIIEDDMENIVWHTAAAEPPIRSFPGAENCVVYIDSFTLQFFPGIKIGYLIAPNGFKDAFTGAKLLFDRASPEQTQAVLAHFLMSDAYDIHRCKIAKTFQRNFQLIKILIEKELSEFGHLSMTKCGSHISFHLNKGYDVIAANELEKLGVIVQPLSSFLHDGDAQNGFMLGFGTFSQEEIEHGIKLIRHTLEKLNF